MWRLGIEIVDLIRINNFRAGIDPSGSRAVSTSMVSTRSRQAKQLSNFCGTCQFSLFSAGWTYLDVHII